MPELPDITVYAERLQALLEGKPLGAVRVRSPFLLRSVEPPLGAVAGQRVLAVERLGKRLVWALSDDLFLVMHLMIAGRLHWKAPGAALTSKRTLAAFDFEHGCVLFTEASTQQRASLHVVRGRADLATHDRGGLEPLQCSLDAFRERLLAENRTLKRALTNPRAFSGIGNAYSDEILHAAGLSPVRLTSQLADAELHALYDATRETLATWVERLRAEAGPGLPERVTAFREEMAVHGRFGQPCPRCATQVQRIRYASNEVNYCPRCQTGGRLLADRSLSRLLRSDWPRSIDEWEGDPRFGGAGSPAEPPAAAAHPRPEARTARTRGTARRKAEAAAVSSAAVSSAAATNSAPPTAEPAAGGPPKTKARPRRSRSAPRKP